MCVVEGLGGEELRQITSRQEQMDPEEKYRRVEFNTPAYNMLNALEKLGYSVVTCCSFVSNSTSEFASKYLVWTLHKN